MAIGADGNPVIGYADRAAGTLKVAKCASTDCADDGLSITTVHAEPTGSSGLQASIAVGSD